MITQFFSKYKRQLLLGLVICAILMFGFLLGRYGKNAPNIEVAESSTEKVNNEIISEVEQETTNEEHTEPEYTEINVTATAYCPCKKCCGKSDGITATGTKATSGRTIAVDKNVIPYGTNVIIDGHTYIAEDCGGAVNGNKIDIFFDTHEEALAFGKRQLTVKIIEVE